MSFDAQSINWQGLSNESYARQILDDLDLFIRQCDPRQQVGGVLSKPLRISLYNTGSFIYSQCSKFHFPLDIQCQLLARTCTMITYSVGLGGNNGVGFKLMDKDANRLLRVHTRTAVKFHSLADLAQAKRFLARAEGYVTPGVLALEDGANTAFTAFAQRAEIEYKEGNYDNALAYADKLVELASTPSSRTLPNAAPVPRGPAFHEFPSAAALLYRLAVECAAREEFAQAAQWLRRGVALLELAPAEAARQARNCRLLCVCACELGDLDTATQAVDRAHALVPCGETIYLKIRVAALMDLQAPQPAGMEALSKMLQHAVQHPEVSMDMCLSLLAFLAPSHAAVLAPSFAQLRLRYPLHTQAINAAEALCAVECGDLRAAAVASARVEQPSDTLLCALWARAMHCYDHAQLHACAQWCACVARMACDAQNRARALLAAGQALAELGAPRAAWVLGVHALLVAGADSLCSEHGRADASTAGSVLCACHVAATASAWALPVVEAPLAVDGAEGTVMDAQVDVGAYERMLAAGSAERLFAAAPTYTPPSLLMLQHKAHVQLARVAVQLALPAAAMAHASAATRSGLLRVEEACLLGEEGHRAGMAVVARMALGVLASAIHQQRCAESTAPRVTMHEDAEALDASDDEVAPADSSAAASTRPSPGTQAALTALLRRVPLTVLCGASGEEGLRKDTPQLHLPRADRVTLLRALLRLDAATLVRMQGVAADAASSDDARHDTMQVEVDPRLLLLRVLALTLHLSDLCSVTLDTAHTRASASDRTRAHRREPGALAALSPGDAAPSSTGVEDVERVDAVARESKDSSCDCALARELGELAYASALLGMGFSRQHPASHDHGRAGSEGVSVREAVYLLFLQAAAAANAVHACAQHDVQATAEEAEGNLCERAVRCLLLAVTSLRGEDVAEGAGVAVEEDMPLDLAPARDLSCVYQAATATHTQRARAVVLLCGFARDVLAVGAPRDTHDTDATARPASRAQSTHALALLLTVTHFRALLDSPAPEHARALEQLLSANDLAAVPLHTVSVMAADAAQSGHAAATRMLLQHALMRVGRVLSDASGRCKRATEAAKRLTAAAASGDVSVCVYADRHAQEALQHAALEAHSVWECLLAVFRVGAQAASVGHAGVCAGQGEWREGVATWVAAARALRQTVATCALQRRANPTLGDENLAGNSDECECIAALRRLPQSSPAQWADVCVGVEWNRAVIDVRQGRLAEGERTARHAIELRRAVELLEQERAITLTCATTGGAAELGKPADSSATVGEHGQLAVMLQAYAHIQRMHQRAQETDPRSQRR